MGSDKKRRTTFCGIISLCVHVQCPKGVEREAPKRLGERNTCILERSPQGDWASKSGGTLLLWLSTLM